MRQIVLDTETTGMPVKDGHRIIEIGAVEIINRRLTGNNYHQYINPEREVDPGAFDVHGISNEMLSDKPVFSEIVKEFAAFIKDSELIIHNAPFDVGFMDFEFSLIRSFNKKTADLCRVTDSLLLAKKMHPGQRNSLDALCKRYYIDNTNRELHGALLDAELLADVYLAMTGGQIDLSFSNGKNNNNDDTEQVQRVDPDLLKNTIIKASDEELTAHREMLQMIENKTGQCLWNQLEK